MQLKLTKDHISALVVPGLALSYSLYALWELNMGKYRDVTIIYTSILALPILICVGIILFRTFRSEALPPSQSQASEQLHKPVVLEGRGKRLFLVIASTFALVFVLPWLGHIISFMAYTIFTLRVMRVRSLTALILIPLIMTATVHGVFIELLDQDLPFGILEPLLTR